MKTLQLIDYLTSEAPKYSEGTFTRVEIDRVLDNLKPSNSDLEAVSAAEAKRIKRMQRNRRLL